MAQAILDGAGVLVPNGSITDCYDQLGHRYHSHTIRRVKITYLTTFFFRYEVPIYCLSYPINIVKEDGRDSPAIESEQVDAGTETILKLRLSHNCSDIKLAVYSKDSISVCKKKLQVSVVAKAWLNKKQKLFFLYRVKKELKRRGNDGFLAVNF